MTAQIVLEKSILKWLMKLAENNLDAATQGKIAEWNTYAKKPTFAQLSNLSQKLHIPLGYLFLKNPPEEKVEILDYRTIDSKSVQQPSRDLIDTVDDMKMIQGWMREYLVNEGYSQFPYGNSAARNADELVKSIRKDVGLQEDWYTQFKDARRAFNYLREAFSNAGVTIMMNGIVGNNTKRPLRLEEFRAFAMYDEYAPLVFINSKDNNTGRCFSLVHEIAHLWLKKNSFYNATPEKKGGSREETICNAVAAEILVPNKFFVKEWENLDDKDNVFECINKVASIFSAGKIIVARRALDNKLIKKDEYEHVFSTIMAAVVNKPKTTGGGNYYSALNSKIDHRFFNCLHNSVLEGKTRYMDAFRMTGTTGKSFRELASMTGGNA